MPIKYKKQVRHYRASRHNGWGIQGQHRKKGLIGGAGNTGLQKHKWTWLMAKGSRSYFGKHGFTRPPCSVEKINTINLKVLEQKLPTLEKRGIVEKKGTRLLIDLQKLGIKKLLGTGKVTGKYDITVKYASANAKKKVEEAGGTVTLLAAEPVSE
ncbi:MAG: uL15m family ribosomal protein [Promethearchaeota archaeon]